MFGEATTQLFPWVDCLVTVGVPSRLEYPMGQFREMVGMRPKTWAWFLKYFEQSLGMSVQQVDAAAFGENLNIPGLIVHCRDDYEVAFHQGERIHDSWPGATLLATEGLGHRRILKDPEVITATVSFLRTGG